MQLSFAELGTPLADTTFVVVDVETTGTAPQTQGITEIGAVKLRGGVVLGEFTTLVNPGIPIPPQVAALTGITTEMVRTAPGIEQVLPPFLEFCSGAVLVAHNARFDTGFLRAACRTHGHPWPRPTVVCTLRLARRVLPRHETRNHRLATLATFLGARTSPNHRALEDARATGDVLHALFERIGPLGVHSLEGLLDHLSGVSPHQRRKQTMADHLPQKPGVYLFRGPNEEALYVGTASNLRRRARQYFTGSEERSRMREMVALAQRIDGIECAHSLEGEVRELRLLAAHRPAYNRRLRQPQKAWWLVLTDEAFPRLSVVRTPRPGALGPLPSRTRAQDVADILADTAGLRTCSMRIPARGGNRGPCVLAELGRCGAPCVGRQSVDQYTPSVRLVTDLIAGTDDTLLHTARAELDDLAAAQQFERAARRRDELATLIHEIDRAQRLAALAAIAELVAAAPDGAGGWELTVIRYGRLVSAGTAPHGTAPMPVVETLLASAETVIPEPGPLPGTFGAETRVLLRWLTRPGVRLVRSTAPWAEPTHGAARWFSWLEQAGTARALENLD